MYICIITLYPLLWSCHSLGQLVDDLLFAAVSATADAPNRAVKRRVRQRLHKKLGAVLKKEELQPATFKRTAF